MSLWCLRSMVSHETLYCVSYLALKKCSNNWLIRQLLYLPTFFYCFWFRYMITNFLHMVISFTNFSQVLVETLHQEYNYFMWVLLSVSCKLIIYFSDFNNSLLIFDRMPSVLLLFLPCPPKWEKCLFWDKSDA